MSTDKNTMAHRFCTEPDYRRGFNAYHEGLTDDIGESAAWHEGYEDARSLDASEG